MLPETQRVCYWCLGRTRGSCKTCREIVADINEGIALTAAKLGAKSVDGVCFYFGKTLEGPTIGYARVLNGNYSVTLSSGCLTGLDSELRREVIQHELCHIVVWRDTGLGVPDHGEEWQERMRRLGYSQPRWVIDASPSPEHLELRCGCRRHWANPEWLKAALCQSGALVCERCSLEFKRVG